MPGKYFLGECRASSFRLSFHLNKGNSYHVLQYVCYWSMLMIWSWKLWECFRAVLWLFKLKLKSDKIKDAVPQLHYPHFKWLCSHFTGQGTIQYVHSQRVLVDRTVLEIGLNLLKCLGCFSEPWTFCFSLVGREKEICLNVLGTMSSSHVTWLWSLSFHL